MSTNTIGSTDCLRVLGYFGAVADLLAGPGSITVRDTHEVDS